MPETRFEDVIRVNPKDGDKKVILDIDPEFIFVCDKNSIVPVSHTTSHPCMCGIRVINDKIEITIDAVQTPKEIVIKLSGIRKGRSGKRFATFSEEEARRNEAFWSTWQAK
jgi:hypothetical protein